MSAGRQEPQQGVEPVTVLRTAQEQEQELTQRKLREVMAQFATGITVLTARGRLAHGMTANAFTSVSLDPPMVLCCVGRTSRIHEAIIDADHFGVSVLSNEQEQVGRYFASRDRPSGMAQFERFPWFPGPHSGVPLLNGSLAWLECDLAEVYEGGDHSIFLGLVRSASRGTGRALLFLDGGFHQYDPPTAQSA
ncbi:flavin reductase (DIM6/NTAB) family NADH-FMN oxidoreductase RutF [Actinophytocola algeriensis]|uniref:Flavin reductase (DIM6/NTAB) family NADH-FMN oxidoreductase RutF n=2 Tax=Actinophytocola algeriensis TaxID=1768010 RepID=A0A7W7VGG9_9PSEU|nr:flavin reductase (DIM6/NTAB) family NADH-FMN oxidoreductase RutF [Actinophytocola algeriensis]MBE1475333.1 flavin reductase (DIM6/NTAB) family NADH-FMN oxidoreductase RutF [Actinophytocola algeriensis]